MPPAPVNTFGQETGKAGGTIVPAPDKAYFKAPTESVDQYNSRIQDYNASKNAPASEPAVLSSEGAADKIAGAQTKLADMGQKGTTIDQKGNALYSDGSMVPAPAGAVYNDKTGQYEAADGRAYGAADFYGQNDQGTEDPDYTAVKNLFAPLKASLDANTLGTVNAIEQQFDSLRGKQETANAQAEQSRAQSLLLGGATRYAPLTASGINLAQTSFGLQQIQDLDAKENSALAAAKAAQQDGDMKLMTDQITMAEGIRKDKQTKAADLAQKLADANDKMRTTAIQSSRDSAIADLVNQGVTDPAQILDMLNSYDDGTPTGGDFTADEIAKTLKSIADATGTNGIKGLTGDVGNFYTLKNTPGALPASILALPPDQQMAAYIKMVNQAKSTAQPKMTSSGGGAPINDSNISQTAKDYAASVLDGNATMQQVPAAWRDQVAYLLNHQDTQTFSPLAVSRFTMGSNRIVGNYIQLPQYQLTANGLPYLQRIDAAMKHPGSVSDQDLLDSLTKLNTAGNAISDAQVKLITDGKSWADSIGTALNKVGNGGVLSGNQRQQIQDIAKAIFANYQKGYQPVYDQVTKQLKDSGIPEAFWTIPDLNNLTGQIQGGGYGGSPSSPIGSSDTFDNFLSSAPAAAGAGAIDWSSAQ